MAEPPDSLSTARVQAAALTFAMLQFEQEAAHPRQGSPSREKTLGVDEFLFLPSWKPVPRAEMVSFLANLSAPALLVQTTMRGAIALMLLDELSGERRWWGEKNLSNQLAGVNALAEQFQPPLGPDSKLLLETRHENHIVTLDVLRYWAEHFSCPAGWNIGAPRPGAPAEVAAQIRLFSADGRVSPPSQVAAPWERPAW